MAHSHYAKEIEKLWDRGIYDADQVFHALLIRYKAIHTASVLFKSSLAEPRMDLCHALLAVFNSDYQSREQRINALFEIINNNIDNASLEPNSEMMQLLNTFFFYYPKLVPKIENPELRDVFSFQQNWLDEKFESAWDKTLETKNYKVLSRNIAVMTEQKRDKVFDLIYKDLLIRVYTEVILGVEMFSLMPSDTKKKFMYKILDIITHNKSEVFLRNNFKKILSELLKTVSVEEITGYIEFYLECYPNLDDGLVLFECAHLVDFAAIESVVANTLLRKFPPENHPVMLGDEVVWGAGTQEGQGYISLIKCIIKMAGHFSSGNAVKIFLKLTKLWGVGVNGFEVDILGSKAIAIFYLVSSDMQLKILQEFLRLLKTEKKRANHHAASVMVELFKLAPPAPAASKTVADLKASVKPRYVIDKLTVLSLASIAAPQLVPQESKKIISGMAGEDIGPHDLFEEFPNLSEIGLDTESQISFESIMSHATTEDKIRCIRYIMDRQLNNYGYMPDVSWQSIDIGKTINTAREFNQILIVLMEIIKESSSRLILSDSMICEAAMNANPDHSAWRVLRYICDIISNACSVLPPAEAKASKKIEQAITLVMQSILHSEYYNRGDSKYSNFDWVLSTLIKVYDFASSEQKIQIQNYLLSNIDAGYTKVACEGLAKIAKTLKEHEVVSLIRKVSTMNTPELLLELCALQLSDRKLSAVLKETAPLTFNNEVISVVRQYCRN